MSVEILPIGTEALGSQANTIWQWNDDNLPAKFHRDPFSRFAEIHVAVQFAAKTQGLVTLEKNLGETRLTAANLHSESKNLKLFHHNFPKG